MSARLPGTAPPDAPGGAGSPAPRDAGPTSSLAREVAAWLDTMAVDGETLRSDTGRGMPRSTIIPTVVRSRGQGQRALDLLEHLSALSPTANAQLRPGVTIGEGGMGVVRIAEQVALGRMVAVKTLKPSRQEPHAALDLLREAWVTGSLEHPNIVPVHYLGLDEDGRPLIVLKRIEGLDWSEVMHDDEAVAGRFGATDRLAWNLEILLQVLNAVRFAHSRHIVHRDLKPGNVMIGEFGEVYLLDWGLAVSLVDDGTGRLPLATDATELAGTPCYMAPEMLGEEDGVPLSERTDVYLAGAVLYEIITGEPPHAGSTALEIIASVSASRPTLPPGVPAELGRICLRAMAFDPADRYPSIDLLRRAIQHYLGHRGSARLAELAQVRLDELLAVVAAPRPPDATVPDGEAPPDDTEDTHRRERVHRLFGACRFGFHEALVAWRDNDDARAGLERATVAVAEYALACDDPRAAIGLLTELERPPPALLDRARAAAAANERRDAALEALRAQHDAKVGTRTRTFIAVILGLLFTTMPLSIGLAPTAMPRLTHRGGLLLSVGFLSVIVGLGYWARESLLKTVINRRIGAMALILFVAQAGLVAGCWHLGVSIVTTEVLMLFLWAVIAGSIAIGIDAGLAPAAIAYSIGFAVAVRWPEHRHFVMAGVNFGFTVNAVVRWRPDRWRRTPQERVARKQISGPRGSEAPRRVGKKTS